jgi:hypothetical protein
VAELSNFVWLIIGLTKVNKWNEALQLCYSIRHEVSLTCHIPLSTSLFLGDIDKSY